MAKETNTVGALSFGLALVLAVEPAAASWERGRTLPQGTRISIRVPDRLAPKGERRLRGTIESASADAVAVRTKDRALRSVPRNRILTVKIHVPSSKRITAWTATVCTAVGMLVIFPNVTPGSASPYDREHGGLMLAIAAAVILPVSVAVHLQTRWRTVYRA